MLTDEQKRLHYRFHCLLFGEEIAELNQMTPADRLHYVRQRQQDFDTESDQIQDAGYSVETQRVSNYQFVCEPSVLRKC